MSDLLKPEPSAGDIWRHTGDERKGHLRDIEIDQVTPSFVYATGVQSHRSTRIRLDNNGRLREYHRIARGSGAPE